MPWPRASEALRMKALHLGALRMNDAFSLDGRVALVTGASRGLGWAIARALARAGAEVALNGRDPGTLEKRAAEISSEGGKATTAPFDVTKEADAKAAVESLAAERGRLDILVANAGIQHRAPLEEHGTADFARVIDTNLTACFTLARAVASPMRRQKSGRIIMTASIMSLVARPTIPGYVAAKGGLAALVRALAVELGPEGITCNAIAPGFIETEMTEALKAKTEFSSWVSERTPLGRWGLTEEIAGPAVFLASDAAAYVSGHLLTVDGGMTINA